MLFSITVFLGVALMIAAGSVLSIMLLVRLWAVLTGKHAGRAMNSREGEPPLAVAINPRPVGMQYPMIEPKTKER